MARRTYRQLVTDIALDNRGFVTTSLAAAVGVPAIELPKLAARGGLEHVAYGLYRVPIIPRDSLTPYAEALFRAGEGALLAAESVRRPGPRHGESAADLRRRHPSGTLRPA